MSHRVQGNRSWREGHWHWRNSTKTLSLLVNSFLIVLTGTNPQHAHTYTHSIAKVKLAAKICSWLLFLLCNLIAAEKLNTSLYDWILHFFIYSRFSVPSLTRVDIIIKLMIHADFTLRNILDCSSDFIQHSVVSSRQLSGEVCNFCLSCHYRLFVSQNGFLFILN